MHYVRSSHNTIQHNTKMATVRHLEFSHNRQYPRIYRLPTKLREIRQLPDELWVAKADVFQYGVQQPSKNQNFEFWSQNF